MGPSGATVFINLSEAEFLAGFSYIWVGLGDAGICWDGLQMEGVGGLGGARAWAAGGDVRWRVERSLGL